MGYILFSNLSIKGVFKKDLLLFAFHMAWYQIDPCTMVSNALGFLRHILQLLTAFFAYFSELERKMEGSFLKTFILKKQKQTEQRALKELHSLA